MTNNKKKVDKIMVGMFTHNRHITDPMTRDVRIFKKQCKIKNKENRNSNKQIKFQK
jgi:hypothetical protein